ncbi:MAG TPA: heavy metal-binding domain-containing protein [Pyrinomonadaceae bacterium]|nr:heavy metal-binding domain-containing protein [Pyrinomonadaceae bacterium]
MSLLQKTLESSVTLLLLLALAGIMAPSVVGQGGNVNQSSAPMRSVVYSCPMHPDVRATKPGSCFKCGMTLVGTTAPVEVIEYGLKLETTPLAVKAGEETTLRFHILHPKTGEQVKGFNVIHEMLFHLFIVSKDLEYYEHIHPTQDPDGSFRINVKLPQAGDYEVYSDFFPVGGTAQVIHRSLRVAGAHDAHGAHNVHSSEHQFLQTSLVPDSSLIKSKNGIRFELKLEPAQPVAGQPMLLKYYLVDEETGLPVKDLQPYLGAWGHTVTIREEATDFLHSHSTKLIPAGSDSSKLLSGPRVSFNTFFARSGFYRIWSQFQRKDKVITVSFTVYVSRLERIAKWDGSGWSSLVGNPINGLDGPVRALAVSGTDLYLGGDFTSIDGIRANRIAKWDGHSWSDLQGGVNGNVWAIAVSGSNVYVAGEFTSAGGKSANGIAKWDGRNWSTLGTGINGRKDAFGSPAVYALATSGNDLYAGGRFATAGDVLVNGIAKWNGHKWSALGGGVRTGTYEGVVRALALRGRDLYAGGQFIDAGGVAAYNIAKWNGHRWSALGTGIRGNLEEVLALGVSGSDVYAGGIFIMAGGQHASNIAKWNGSNWSPLAIQPFDGVRKIAVNGSTVYIGGSSFTLPTGIVTTGVAKWDGSNWSALGSGLGNGPYSGPIMAIATSGTDLYVGGDAFAILGAPTHPTLAN